MENTHNDEMEIDLMELFYALKRRIFFILSGRVVMCDVLSAAYYQLFYDTDLHLNIQLCWF